MMRHLVLLVEEPSMEAFLRELLPRLLPACRTIEELEAWYFGDWEAVRAAYPRVSPNIPQGSRYRDPDAIKGGTWEAFERIMQRHGYFETGLRKIEAARAVAARMEVDRNRSLSFVRFHEIIAEATA